ncbi:M14 family zinc carboxypeptidase [Microbacterium sp. NPDC055910]|uniref:M14 family zinc carboxypeptidase n=1 Tax=Microbacterium sp. NPDC055910 TaxID=3345659 RepID=UPI0035E2E9F7
MFDGYSGASTSCSSDTHAGPSELSEPESRNIDWLAANYPKIRFSMNLHSSGDYFMWSPGAYKLPGRETTPRPSAEDEAYFWEASSRILTEIKRYRGLSVTPARTGPIVDVLYSAAGNSGDMFWYKYGIYAWNFEVARSLQPPFTSANPTAAAAHPESQEYANGLMELMRVALDRSRVGLDAEVATRCLAGKVYTSVSVTNNDTVPADIRVTSGHGGKSFTAVQPGQTVSVSINTRTATLTAGEIGITGTAGDRTDLETSVTYAATNCG